MPAARRLRLLLELISAPVLLRLLAPWPAALTLLLRGAALQILAH
jgi:hypothetical protein